MQRSSNGDPGEKSFDRGPASDLWRHTLSQIPTTFGRLVFVSGLRDANTGAYAHYGLAEHFGMDVASNALKGSHEGCFSEWLNFEMAEKKADLDLYLLGLDSDHKTILETWIRTKPYMNLIPAAEASVERDLFQTDLEILLEQLMAVHGVSFPDRNA